MDRSLADSLHATQRPPRWTLLRFLPIGIVVLASAVTLLGGAQKQISLSGFLMSREMIADYVASHYWAAIGTYFGVYVAVVALSIPGAAILSIIGGVLFGAALAGCLAITAATLGAVIFFSAARTSLRDLLRRSAGSTLKRFSVGFQRDAASYLLFLRLLPVFPFWLINLAAALVGVPYSTFIWTTMVGIIPGTFAFACAGAGIDSIAAAERAAYVNCLAKSHVRCVFEFNASLLMTRELLLAFAGLGLVALIPVVVKRCRPAVMPPS
jgi:uncharacterized membrane protein YdjX (TVP38/TMEM64 family)